MISKKRNLRKKNKRRTKKRKIFKKGKGRETDRKLLLDRLGTQYGISIPNDIIDKIVDYSIKYEDAERLIQKNTKRGVIVVLDLQLLEVTNNQTMVTFKKWCQSKLVNIVKDLGSKICNEEFVDIKDKPYDKNNLMMIFIVDNVDVDEAKKTVKQIKDIAEICKGYINEHNFRAVNARYMPLYDKLPCRTITTRRDRRAS